jgi:putative ABC transport system substrate-binding protein
MKTYARVLLCLLLAGLVVGPLAAEGQAEDDTIEIGISKFVAHPALDAVEQGIMDQLTELGYEDISYDLQNANAEGTTANQIASKFKADRVDVAVGIATPTAQALVNTLDDIPVVFSAVTDPVEAGLVESFDEGGENVTGYSDMTPVREQISFLNDLVGLDALGHVYSSGEANAVTLADMAREACTELGIEFVEATVTNSAEVRQATQSIINRVDGIYVSTDNTVVSALSSLTDVALRNDVPVMSADPSSAEIYGVLAAWGFDYYKHGRATGRLVHRILEGEEPASIPTQFMTDPSDVTLLINLDVAEQLGVSFPQDVRENANLVVQDGELTEQ